MNWIPLNDIKDLDQIDALSQEKPVVVLKHSTRCNISATALSRLERNYADSSGGAMAWYYLDLLKHRDISNAIEERYEVPHESPQVLVIRNGKCVYQVSHFDIRYDEIVDI